MGSRDLYMKISRAVQDRTPGFFSPFMHRQAALIDILLLNAQTILQMLSENNNRTTYSLIFYYATTARRDN